MTILEWVLILAGGAVMAFFFWLQERMVRRDSGRWADGVIACLKAGLDKRCCPECGQVVWQESWMEPSCPRCGTEMEEASSEGEGKV